MGSMYQAFADENRFGLFFENVKGFDIPVMTGVLGASRETYAIALETVPDEINAKWVHALLNPVSAELTDSAPCQEVVIQGDDVDLGILPIPVWTPGKDAAPYITSTVPCLKIKIIWGLIWLRHDMAPYVMSPMLKKANRHLLRGSLAPSRPFTFPPWPMCNMVSMN